MLNCNKRSITVNMKDPVGKEVSIALLKPCDVVMENFGPGVIDRLGFPGRTFHAINLRIVMASIKGFGSSGPYTELKACENVIAGNGRRDGHDWRQRRAPYVTSVQIGDAGTGLHFAIGILRIAATSARTGSDQYVEVAMRDSVMNLLNEAGAFAKDPLIVREYHLPRA